MSKLAFLSFIRILTYSNLSIPSNDAIKHGDDTSQVTGQELSFDLGKMIFYGDRRHCPWA